MTDDTTITAVDLPGFMQVAHDNAPAVRRLFDDSGIDPVAIRTPEDLTQLPVTKKEAFLDLQRADPPFGGFRAVPVEELRHIYVSAGPLYDLQGVGDEGMGFGRVFEAAGIGPGDVALNTWSYHLVPAGVAFDEALTTVGATVIPAGVGNTDLQAQVIVELGVTVVVASTAFFVTLTEKLEELGYELPRDWNVKLAFLGGEPGDWYGRRRALEERFSVRTFSAYGTGDLGMVGWECGTEPGYHVVPTRIVQICDPGSGMPVADGAVGEIVVTSLNKAYPLIRFGTGDTGSLLPGCSCGRSDQKLSPIAGRVGDAVKVREIFIYPRSIEGIVAQFPGLSAARVIVTRQGHRDHLLLRLQVDSQSDGARLTDEVGAAFSEACRLRPDAIEVADDDLDHESPITDQRSQSSTERRSPDA